VKIRAIDLYRYALPLTDPLPVGGTTLDERRGLLLRVTLGNGAVGWGDAAPLPGFSSESVEEACDGARRLAPVLTGQEIGGKAIQERLAETAPSVQFAVETAVLEARAEVQGSPPAAVLGAENLSVSLNALCTSTRSALTSVGEKLRAGGFRAVKLKMGRASMDADVKRVRTLRRGLGDAVALRLDANRAWAFDDAVAIAKALDDVDVAYVEEPIATPERLPAFVEKTGWPVALDETTRERGLDVLRDGSVRAVVLKPTLLGGVASTQAWIRAARDQEVVPVLSATYESGVGLRMLASMAAAWAPAPAGLSTYVRLADDVLRPRLALGGPTADIPFLYRSRVETARLRPISIDSQTHSR